MEAILPSNNHKVYKVLMGVFKWWYEMTEMTPTEHNIVDAIKQRTDAALHEEDEEIQYKRRALAELAQEHNLEVDF